MSCMCSWIKSTSNNTTQWISIPWMAVLGATSTAESPQNLSKRHSKPNLKSSSKWRTNPNNLRHFTNSQTDFLSSFILISRKITHQSFRILFLLFLLNYLLRLLPIISVLKIVFLVPVKFRRHLRWTHPLLDLSIPQKGLRTVKHHIAFHFLRFALLWDGRFLLCSHNIALLFFFLFPQIHLFQYFLLFFHDNLHLVAHPLEKNLPLFSVPVVEIVLAVKLDLLLVVKQDLKKVNLVNFLYDLLIGQSRRVLWVINFKVRVFELSFENFFAL